MLRSGCYLRVGVIGINYKTADLSLRETFARISERISGERALFLNHPTVLLSTCNRTEIYFSGEDLAEVHSDLLSFFRPYLNEPFEHLLYAYFGIDCFSHLSRVTSGLDSADPCRDRNSSSGQAGLFARIPSLFPPFLPPLYVSKIA